MLPLKRILCPTDFSADSRAALRAAGEMAQYFNAELTVLHVHVATQPAVWPYEGLGVNPIESGLTDEESMALRRRELENEAAALLPVGVKPVLEVILGEPAEVILETARQRGIEMIIMAPHGHNRLRKAIFGSTAEKVVKESPCPVVTMHAGQELGRRPRGKAAEQARA